MLASMIVVVRRLVRGEVLSIPFFLSPDTEIDLDHGTGTKDPHNGQIGEVNDVVGGTQCWIATYTLRLAVSPKDPISTPNGKGGRKTGGTFGIIPLVKEGYRSEYDGHAEYYLVSMPFHPHGKLLRSPMKGHQEQRMQRQQDLIEQFESQSVEDVQKTLVKWGMQYDTKSNGNNNTTPTPTRPVSLKLWLCRQRLNQSQVHRAKQS